MIVTGTFLDANDQLRDVVPVQFIPEDCPQVDGLGIITAKTVETETDEEGEISILLEQGNYLVRVGVGKKDFFRILVPDSNETADITTLFVSEPVDIETVIQVGVNFRVKAGVFQLKNLDTGLYHRVDMVGGPNVEQIQWTTPGEA